MQKENSKNKTTNRKRKKDVEILNSVTPKNYIMDISKAMNQSTTDDFMGNVIELDVGTIKEKGKEKKIIIITDSQFDKIVKKADRSYNNFDRCVYNAAATLWEAGNEYFTAETIWRAMVGEQDNGSPSEHMVEEIRESIEKQRHIFLKIDFLEQAQAYNIDDEGYFDGYMLSVVGAYLKVSGVVKQGWQFQGCPFFYRYSKLFKQIISVSIERIRITSKEVRSSSHAIQIRDYLLREIEGMKHSKRKRNNHIRYDSIYELLNVTEETYADYPNKTFRIRKQVKGILEGWKKQNYIKSYKEYKEGRVLAGVEITY